MNQITFLGSTNSQFGRGKDKTKRKSRGLLAITGSGIIGGAIGSRLAQTGVGVKRLKKVYGVKKDFNLYEKIESHKVMNPRITKIRNNPKTDKRIIKLLNKARLRGGLKGAAIGAGLGLGGNYLVNKIKNRKEK